MKGFAAWRLNLRHCRANGFARRFEVLGPVGLGLANDGRHRRDGLLRLGRRWQGLALHTGIPPIARCTLLIGRELVAVLIADEAGARSARAVGQPSTRQLMSS